MKITNWMMAGWMAAACLRTASPLETAVRRAVQDPHFDRVIDFGPANEGKDVLPGSAKRVQ